MAHTLTENRVLQRCKHPFLTVSDYGSQVTVADLLIESWAGQIFNYFSIHNLFSMVRHIKRPLSFCPAQIGDLAIDIGKRITVVVFVAGPSEHTSASLLCCGLIMMHTVFAYHFRNSLTFRKMQSCPHSVVRVCVSSSLLFSRKYS